MSDTQTRRTPIRQRLEPAARFWLAAPRRLYRFAALAVKKAGADNLTQQSAALAFITIVSLVPLLAALSFFGTRWLSDYQERTVQVLAQILPYSEETILENLRNFLGAATAKAFQGLGFVAFVVAALAAFTSIEEAINRIWNVPKRRPLRSRLLSFTLLLFWGPLVIGTTYSALFYLGKQPAFRSLAESLPIRLIPFLVTGLALSMLYWLVPYTAVRFKSALAGGFTAAVLLEALRQGFGVYVDRFPATHVIYGSFGLVLFLMLSIQLGWWLVLLGSEIAYSLQNAVFLSRPRRPSAAFEGSWLALAAMVFVTERFRSGRPVVSHELLAERLQLKAGELGLILAPLVEAGLLTEASGEIDGYLLSCDPYELPISRIFELYEGMHREVLAPLAPPLASRLEELRGRLAAARAGESEGILLARLAGAAEAAAAAGALPRPDRRARMAPTAGQ